MNKTIKKIHNIRNKTKRNQEKVMIDLNPLSDKKKEIICKKSPNTYTSFEHKIDEIFKENNIDILSASYNLETEVVKELKKAVSPSNITPENDFYSYINERWLKDLDVQAYQEYITQVDDFRLVQDKVYRELLDIVKEYTTNPKTKNTKHQIT